MTITPRHPLNGKADFSISQARFQKFQSIEFAKVSFSDQCSVSEARKAITEMGVWDTFIDDFFMGGTKREALNAIATILLRAKAEEFHAADPVEELGDENVRNAKFELVASLSTAGACCFAGEWEDTGNGIMFYPKTDVPDVNAMLSTVLSYGQAAILFEKANLNYAAGQTWEKCALAWAQKPDGGLASEAYKNAASQWKTINCHHWAKKALESADEIARQHGRRIVESSENLRHAQEYQDRGNEAAKKGDYELAASQYQAEADMFAAANLPDLKRAADFRVERAKKLADKQA